MEFRQQAGLMSNTAVRSSHWQALLADGVAGEAGPWASSLPTKRATREILMELALSDVLAVLAFQKRTDLAQLAVLV
jgi:hypothetical protein